MESRKSFRILKFKKSKPVLKINGISKSYGHRLVLKKINFELHKSEIFGVLGPNGCGKTTIFNSIMGICKINEGNIFVNNIKINDLAIHEKDTGSSEVQIAILTKKIENLSKHFKEFKKDKHSNVGLLRAVNKRKKLLDYLKRNNAESYKNLLSKLNLRK